MVNLIAGDTIATSGTFNPSPTGLNQLSENGFFIYPNPASDYVQINVINGDNFSINVFNAIGERVYSGKANSKMQFSVRTWTNGIYFIRFQSGSEFYTQYLLRIVSLYWNRITINEGMTFHLQAGGVRIL